MCETIKEFDAASNGERKRGNTEASFEAGSPGHPSIADSISSQMLMSLCEVKRFVSSFVLK